MGEKSSIAITNYGAISILDKSVIFLRNHDMNDEADTSLDGDWANDNDSSLSTKLP